MKPSDAIEEETIEDTVACLLMSDDEAVDKECWMNTRTTGYRAQKATSTVRSKIAQAENFSNYLIRKKYESRSRQPQNFPVSMSLSLDNHRKSCPHPSFKAGRLLLP